MSAQLTNFEQKQKERAEIIDQIKTTLTKLKRPDQVFEIRLFLKDGKTIAGMFDHHHINECINGIFQHYQAAKAIYFVLNDFPADLLSWSANKFRVVRSGDHTVADKHISHRTHILIDIDPKRLSKEGIELADVSSTNEEKEKAKQKLNEILEYLSSLGWPEPMIVDSGNGYHLIFAIDLPNTDNSTTLVKNLLLALAQQFDDPCVQVDKKVFNSSRITKLAGTVARKGDSIEGRPHRTAKILHLPEAMLVVSEEQLREVASLFKEETKTTSPKTENNYSEAKREASNKGSTDLSTRIRNYMDKVPPSISGSDGHKAAFYAACQLVLGYNLSPNEAMPYYQEWNARCTPPWNEKELWHKLKDADKAHSDKPKGYLLNEQRYQQGTTTTNNKNTTSNNIPKNTTPPPVPGKSGRELLQLVFTPPEWVIESLVAEKTVNIFSAKPKLGKSCFALQAGLAISCGGFFLGKQVKERPVLYLALEDSQRRLQDRASKLLLSETIGDGFYYETTFPRLDQGGEEYLEQWGRNHPDSVVIVDVLGKIKPPETKDNKGYAYEYSVISRFKELAETYNITFILVHHNRKQEATDEFDCVSGSNGLTASVDASLVLRRDRGKADAVLAVTGRDVEETEYKLQFNFPHWSMLGEATTYKVSSTRQKLLEILKQANCALSPDEAFKFYCLEYPDDIVKKDNIRQMLYQMTKDKEIAATDRGKYSINISTNIPNKTNTTNTTNISNNSNNNRYVSSNVSYDAVDVSDVSFSNIRPNIANSIEIQGVTDKARNVRNVSIDAQKISQPKTDNYQNNRVVSENTTIYAGQHTISGPDIAQPFITASPGNALARRALECAEWLAQNQKLVPRIVTPVSIMNDPLDRCRFLERQFRQGVTLPELVKDLDAIELAVKEAYRSMNTNSVGVS